eukprot:13935575-Heterocapsa_arctica.AAC.1
MRLSQEEIQQVNAEARMGHSMLLSQEEIQQVGADNDAQWPAWTSHWGPIGDGPAGAAQLGSDPDA